METSPPVPATAPVRYDYLDALRGWAILGVLAVHCASQSGAKFPGVYVAFAGKYGVQLFFMVSAFTIFLTLDRSAAKDGRPAWDEFFIRRLFRILPMFWIGLALYIFVPGRAFMYGQVAYGPADYFLTAILQHGWHPSLINALVPGGWSIAVEGTFYLLTPLFYRAIRTWQAAVWLLLGTALVGLRGTIAVAESENAGELFAGVPREFMPDFYSTWFPSQLPVFACGLLVYHVVKARGLQPADRATGAVLLAVTATALCASPRMGTHGWITEPVFFALAFVPLVLGLERWPAPLLVNRATRLLGKISFSAYVLHFMVLSFVIDQLSRLPRSYWPGDLAALVVVFVLTLAGTVAVSSLAWRFVEQPFINLGAKWIRARRATRATGRELEHAAPLPSSARG